MNNFTDTELIEAYLNGSLSQSEKNVVEQRLQTDVDWQQEVFTLFLAKNVFKRYPLLKAQEIACLLSEDLSVNKKTSNRNQIKHEEAYNTEELVAMFKPLVHLEQEVILRSGNTETSNLQHCVVFPLPEIICLNEKLIFELEKELDFELEVAVFNNIEQEILPACQYIPPQTINFTLQLPAMLPGRYYWQITPTNYEQQAIYGSATGTFFIKLDLLTQHNH